MKSFQENAEYKATIDKHRRSKTFEDEDVVIIYLHKKILIGTYNKFVQWNYDP